MEAKKAEETASVVGKEALAAVAAAVAAAAHGESVNAEERKEGVVGVGKNVGVTNTRRPSLPFPLPFPLQSSLTQSLTPRWRQKWSRRE